MTIEKLNNLPDVEAKEALLKCCGSAVWVDKMLQQFPFTSEKELLEKAEESWFGQCNKKDWLEAFMHHPKIGAIKTLDEKFALTKEWTSLEQAGVQNAEADTVAELTKGNKEYEDKFGFIFIVCATGKTADEMLQLLRQRLLNSYEQELLIAMKEQGKITILRLQKLLL